MYEKISIYVACISIIFVDVKVAENGFEQRLNRDIELTVCKADVNSNCFKDLKDLFCTSLELLKENSNRMEEKLEKESCGWDWNPFVYYYDRKNMCKAFEAAKPNCVYDLPSAECRAVRMYTSNLFYSNYNSRMREGRWRSYKVFNALLYSALDKLKKNLKPPFYRGLKGKFKVSERGEFYFQQFTSTSLDSDIVKRNFGSETVIIFNNVPILAGGIQQFSFYTKEKEVLISPFEAFKFVSQNGSELHLKSAKKQDILYENMSVLCGSGQAPKMVSGLTIFCLLSIKAVTVYLIVQ